jgi:hypothetical protein
MGVRIEEQPDEHLLPQLKGQERLGASREQGHGVLAELEEEVNAAYLDDLAAPHRKRAPSVARGERGRTIGSAQIGLLPA